MRHGCLLSLSSSFRVHCMLCLLCKIKICPARLPDRNWIMYLIEPRSNMFGRYVSRCVGRVPDYALTDILTWCRLTHIDRVATDISTDASTDTRPSVGRIVVDTRSICRWMSISAAMSTDYRSTCALVDSRSIYQPTYRPRVPIRFMIPKTGFFLVFSFRCCGNS